MALPTYLVYLGVLHSFYVSSPNQVLLLISVVFPGWFCGRDPTAQANFNPVGKQKPYLQSSLEPPWFCALLLSILCLLQPSPSLPAARALPLSKFLCCTLSLPCALSFLTLAFACDYWKPQALASREIYS